jgi:hypothetical protein
VIDPCAEVIDPCAALIDPCAALIDPCAEVIDLRSVDDDQLPRSIDQCGEVIDHLPRPPRFPCGQRPGTRGPVLR